MPYSVLIVEDDPMVAMINEQYVRKNKQFTVLGACRNGQEALDFLEDNSADLIILDVYMPIMDGVETLKQLRQRKCASEVIMVTAANDAATLEDTMHLGVLDYLIKPFAYERFQVALEKFEAKRTALSSASVLDQSSVDSIMARAGGQEQGGQHGGAAGRGGSEGGKDYPKGIQEKTLMHILEYLEAQKGWLNGDVIAENVGLSAVTVRHYMNYIVNTGKASESINYETGGRPCVLYRWNAQKA
ncbi:MAG: response regulator [Treponema sp.]|nr:response regulator [Treponema sp.]